MEIKNKNKNKKYYLTKNRRKAKLKIKIIISLLAITIFSGVFAYQFYALQSEIDNIINRQNLTVAVPKPKNKPVAPEVIKASSTPKILEDLGAMGMAIEVASKEFGVPHQLIVGIANAESSLGKKFHLEYDRNCANWWGLKGGNMKNRKDGSSLRCFDNELAGARTIAKTLKLYYLDEGRTTARKIANKYVGANQSQYHEQWIANVEKYYKK